MATRKQKQTPNEVLAKAVARHLSESHAYEKSNRRLEQEVAVLRAEVVNLRAGLAGLCENGGGEF